MKTATAQTEQKASASLLAHIRVNQTRIGRMVEDAEARSRGVIRAASIVSQCKASGGG